MQDCSISIANALDILRSYTRPSSWCYYLMGALVPFWYHVKRLIVWSRKVSNLQNWVSNALVTLTFDKFQSDRRTLNTDLTPMRLCEILCGNLMWHWKALKDTIVMTTMQGLCLAMNQLWQNAYRWFPDYPTKENRTWFLSTQTMF